MDEREIEVMRKNLQRQTKEALTHTKEQSVAFLHSIGVLTKKGNPTKRYKDLLIPKGKS